MKNNTSMSFLEKEAQGWNVSKVVSMGVDFIYWPALCEGIPTPSSITVSAVFPPPPSSGHWRPRIRSDTRYCFGSLLRLRCTQSLPPPLLPLHISAALSVHPHRHRGLSLYPPSLVIYVGHFCSAMCQRGQSDSLPPGVLPFSIGLGACGNRGC